MPASAQENPQARYWILTIKYEDWSPPETLPDAIQWLYGQAEIGQQVRDNAPDAIGYKHWQFICYCFKPIRRNNLKRLFCRSAYLAPTRSEAAEAYVRKDETAVPGSQFELGGKSFKRNSKIDWQKQKELAIAGKIDECEPQLFLHHYRTLKQIKFDYAPTPENLPGTCGIWIFGPPGTGKSHYAREHYGHSLYIKAQNKWWCGYDNEKFVLIDDFDDRKGIFGHMLKQWADKYQFKCEMKGSSRIIRPDKIIITSNYSIQDCFGFDPVLCEAISRRFFKIEIPMRRY